MESYTFEQDLTVMYVTALSFPEGIVAAHEALHRMVPFHDGRRYWGISRPEEPEGPVVYRAAADELHPGEAAALGLETLVLKKGHYATRAIGHYMNNPDSIGQTFAELLQEPNLDPEGYCVEWYLSDSEMVCMIRMRD